jgi:hypothetical protein
MSSETPQEDRRADAEPGHRASPQDRPDTPGSIGRELSVQMNVSRDTVAALGDQPTDAGPVLTAEERKLSADEQRALLAMRRHTDDGVDNTLAELKELNDIQRRIAREGWRVEHRHEIEAWREQRMHGMQPPYAEQATAQKAFGHYEGVFLAMNAGMHALDAQRLPLSADERSNVAGALTAQLAQTPGFNRDGFDPHKLSVAIGQGNDRVFAIHGSHPGAPDAVHANVSVDQAKQQPLQVSAAQATAEPPQPQRTAAQQTEQPSQSTPAVAPRTMS